ncbi:Immunoglobulin G-binding protein A [Venturia nashicola]|nr:Immunoglobulin G-binding protein A [Venturia nashicola]
MGDVMARDRQCTRDKSVAKSRRWWKSKAARKLSCGGFECAAALLIDEVPKGGSLVKEEFDVVGEGEGVRCWSGTQGRKDARTQGRKDARTQGTKDARTQGRKDTRTQGHKDARTQGRKSLSLSLSLSRINGSPGDACRV